MTCRTLPTVDGAPVHCISTPFQYFDGDAVHLFAEEMGELVRFFDSGDTLFHASGSSINFKDKRGMKPLQRIVGDAGATLSDDGEISALAPKTDARNGFRKVMSAVLGIVSWEAENAGISTDATNLASEVEVYLREWKPKRDFLYEQPLSGISGRDHTFAFLLDGELIDVVSSSPQSTAAEVRKLADVRGIPSQSDTQIRVIIDDRVSPKRAQQEAMILSRFADVWLLSALQETVKLPLAVAN
jgi:hypothetical protein